MTTEFRSIVGKVAYFQNKIGPTIANATRELSGHFSNPSTEHWKALGRLIGFLKSKTEWNLVFKAPDEIRGIHICDANYAQCEDSRKSVSGGLDTLGGTLLDWTSKRQPVVALSSCESELISYTDRAQAARFVQLLLKQIIGSEPTAVIFEDNAGCIFLIRNQKTGGRTKHIDTRYFFGRELFDKRQAVPYFIPSGRNWSDGLTKNQPEKLFNEHDSGIMSGVLPYRREDVEMALESQNGRTDGASFGLPS